jgi:hypothetical protein
MADEPVTSGRGKSRQFLGLPWWIWAAGATAAVGGYLYYRHVQNQAASNADTAASPASNGTGTASPTGLTGGQFQQFLLNQQSSPNTAKSGWIKVAGKSVYYSAKNNTIGYKQGGKWTKETV